VVERFDDRTNFSRKGAKTPRRVRIVSVVERFDDRTNFSGKDAKNAKKS
jgi:hypothetical protein